MRQAVRRLRAAYRVLGLGGLARTALLWLVHPTHLVLVRDMSRPYPPAAIPDSARFTLLGPADVERVHGLDPSLSIAEMQRRLAAGYRCLLGWIGDALVMYRWSTSGDTELGFLALILRLDPGDVYVADIFTAPEARRKGWAMASTQHLMVGEKGLRRRIALAAPWNAPAVALSRDAEYGVVGTIGQWRLGPWRRTFATGAVMLEGRRALRVLPTPASPPS